MFQFYTLERSPTGFKPSAEWPRLPARPSERLIIILPGGRPNETSLDAARLDDENSPVRRMSRQLTVEWTRDSFMADSQQAARTSVAKFATRLVPDEQDHVMMATVQDVNALLGRITANNQQDGFLCPALDNWSQNFFFQLLEMGQLHSQKLPYDFIATKLKRLRFIAISGGTTDISLMENSLAQLLQNCDFSEEQQRQLMQNVKVLAISNISAPLIAKTATRTPHFRRCRIVTWREDDYVRWAGLPVPQIPGNDNTSPVMYLKAPNPIILPNGKSLTNRDGHNHAGIFHIGYSRHVKSALRQFNHTG